MGAKAALAWSKAPLHSALARGDTRGRGPHERAAGRRPDSPCLGRARAPCTSETKYSLCPLPACPQAAREKLLSDSSEGKEDVRALTEQLRAVKAQLKANQVRCRCCQGAMLIQICLRCDGHQAA